MSTPPPSPNPSPSPRHRSKRGALAVAMALTALTLALGTAPATADDPGPEPQADGKVTNSPGLATGNLVQAPVHATVNFCGNTISVAGVLNPTPNNVCEPQ
ncbi:MULTISPECIES: chaplin [unclassified Streptomyces]|uniref:chaplin n=2 Tax=unclassified Streptomyces TaxID=2593676 RepID=UPI0033CDC9B7